VTFVSRISRNENRARKLKINDGSHIKNFSNTGHLLKVRPSQQGSSSSGITPCLTLHRPTADTISPVVRNLSVLFAEVTFLVSSGSSVLPWGNEGVSRPMETEKTTWGENLSYIHIYTHTNGKT
jgi:hypothetical protein